MSEPGEQQLRKLRTTWNQDAIDAFKASHNPGMEERMVRAIAEDSEFHPAAQRVTRGINLWYSKLPWWSKLWVRNRQRWHRLVSRLPRGLWLVYVGVYAGLCGERIPSRCRW